MGTKVVDAEFNLAEVMPGFTSYLSDKLPRGTQLLAPGAAEADAGTLSLIPKERLHTVTFEPGAVGFDWDAATGRVNGVTRYGKAESKGVRDGWMIEAVDGVSFNWGPTFSSRQTGKNNYTI